MALSAVQRNASHFIMHLRSLNVHLTKMLSAKNSSAVNSMPFYTLPRQSTGRSTQASESFAPLGTSSFAYQGTNAHVLMSSPSEYAGEHALAFQSVIWEPHRYWILPLAHPLMSFVEVRGNAGSGTIHMSSKLHRPLLDWICDHQVMGRVVCPGAAYMEMSGCVSEICNGTMGTELKSLVLDASIPMPLTLAKPFETENGLITECELSLLVDREQGDIQIRSSNAAKGGSGLHLRASIGLSLDDGLVPSSVCVSESSGPPSPELVRSQCSQSVDSTAMYASLYAVGLQYGPRFQVVSRVSVGSEGKGYLVGCLVHRAQMSLASLFLLQSWMAACILALGYEMRRHPVSPPRTQCSCWFLCVLPCVRPAKQYHVWYCRAW